jgi:hypothetical protein
MHRAEMVARQLQDEPFLALVGWQIADILERIRVVKAKEASTEELGELTTKLEGWAELGGINLSAQQLIILDNG